MGMPFPYSIIMFISASTQLQEVSINSTLPALRHSKSIPSSLLETEPTASTRPVTSIGSHRFLSGRLVLNQNLRKLAFFMSEMRKWSSAMAFSANALKSHFGTCPCGRPTRFSLSPPRTRSGVLCLFWK